jgi:hypothetical protein
MSSGRTSLVLLLGEVGKALDGFGREILGPALNEAGKAIDGSGRETLSPALGGAEKAFEYFGQKELGPALAGTAVVLDEFGKNTLGPALEEVGKAVSGFGRENVGPAVEEAGKWVEQHPTETAMIAGGAFTFLFPTIIYSPILALFGFGSGGVTAGTCLASYFCTCMLRGNADVIPYRFSRSNNSSGQWSHRSWFCIRHCTECSNGRLWFHDLWYHCSGGFSDSCCYRLDPCGLGWPQERTKS